MDRRRSATWGDDDSVEDDSHDSDGLDERSGVVVKRQCCASHVMGDAIAVLTTTRARMSAQLLLSDSSVSDAAVLAELEGKMRCIYLRRVVCGRVGSSPLYPARGFARGMYTSRETARHRGPPASLF